MALRIWLPLNGNDTNQGESGSAAATVAAGSFTAGGIVCSQCMSNGTRSIPYPYYTTGKMSVAVWMKPNNAAAWRDIFGWGSLNSRIEIAATGGTEYRYYGGTSPLITAGTVITTAIPNGAWTHFVMVADGSNVKFYVNGVLALSATQTNTLSANFGSSNLVYVGGYAARGVFNSYINDFRVYDHALSAKEVKELSQGLITRYPMGGVGDACPNIASGSWYADQGVTLGQYYTRVLTDTNFWGLSTGDTFTYSIKITAPSDRNVAARVQFYTGDSDRTTIYGNWIAAGTTGISTVTSTLTAEQRAKTRMELCITNGNSDTASTATTVSVGALKLEKNSIATPWVPHSSSTAYTALGFNSTKLADATGHGHDLTWSALPAVVSGSPRYMTATDFNAAAYASRSSCGVVVPAYTVAFWVRPIANTNQHFIYGGFDDWTHNGMGIYRNANTSKYTVISTSSAESSYGYVYVTAALNTWNHIAITWTGTTLTAYLNGAVAETKTYGSSGTCTFPVMYLGNSMYSGTPAAETEECAISDFRMYATALAADDITALYRAPVSFTDNGEVHACGIHELPGTNLVSVGKSGVVKAAAVSEVYGRLGNEVRMEPDGSAWVRIVHHADPGTGNLFDSSDTFGTWVYKDAKRWFHGKMCDYADRWEFMIEQKANSSASTLKFRWVQTVNPNSAAYADVAAASITKNTSTGYTSFSHGGLYKKNSSAYYTTNNGTQSNWWGAVGAWANTTNGIPAWNGTEVGAGGFEDLYIRLDGGANWSYPDNDRVSIVKTDNSLTAYGITEI